MAGIPCCTGNRVFPFLAATFLSCNYKAFVCGNKENYIIMIEGLELTKILTSVKIYQYSLMHFPLFI